MVILLLVSEALLYNYAHPVATTTPVDQDWNNGGSTSRLPRLEHSKYIEHQRYSLAIAEKAKLINDKAER